MPSARGSHQEGESSEDIYSACPSPKKFKTNNASAEGRSSPYRLKWVVTNRVNYKPPIIRQPYGVKLVDNSVITTEGLWPHSRIHIFNQAGVSQKVIGQGQLLPYDIAITKEGFLAVTDHRLRTVLGFNLDGRQVFKWETHQFEWPNGICRSSQKDYYAVADWHKGRVYVCDPEGREITSFSTDNNNLGHTCPNYLAVDSKQRLIVSDSYDNRVKIFDQLGNFLSSIGTELGNGHLLQPKGIAVDNSDNIVVADWEANCIKKYNSHGQWMLDIGRSDEMIRNPLALDTDGDRVVLTEHKLNGNPSLKMFSLN